MNKQVESWKRLRNIVIKRVKMNTFLELIHSRHSFRGEYQAVPVKREDLIKIMQAGIDAPSGCNKQTTSFIAIDDPHILKQLLNVIDLSLIHI